MTNRGSSASFPLLNSFPGLVRDLTWLFLQNKSGEKLPECPPGRTELSCPGTEVGEGPALSPEGAPEGAPGREPRGSPLLKAAPGGQVGTAAWSQWGGRGGVGIVDGAVPPALPAVAGN